MKGYKGFEKGLVCKGKQYAENTVFEEPEAKICHSGMHFCKTPFDVIGYYGFVNNKAELNEFAEVEALDEVETDDNKKYCTKKIKIGARLSIAEFVKAQVDLTLSKVDFKDSAATNTGDCSAATNTGDWSAATNTGDYSAATVEGIDSVAVACGYKSKAKACLGSAIVIAERGEWNGKTYPLIAIKAAFVDGDIIKENTYYTLVNGEFVEVAE